VIVGGEHERSRRSERKSVADQPERAARVRRPDDLVFAMIGVEKMKHRIACDSGRQCTGQGGLMRGVRIAEQLSREDLGVLAQQRF
jgi:hypothetical protein